MANRKSILLILLICFFYISLNAQINKLAEDMLLKDTAISTGHIGICIYEPATNKYWYNYNEAKYFIPASNTKLFTLYAGIKYLGDSLVGLRYQTIISNSDTIINCEPTGDPTFLHPDFKTQPVYNFLKKNANHLAFSLNENFKSIPLGKGWSWDDYNEDYMAERSSFPINSNLVSFNIQADTIHAFPELFNEKKYSSLGNWNIKKSNQDLHFKIVKNRDENYFHQMYSPNSTNTINIKPIQVPFKTSDNNFEFELLENIVGSRINKVSFTDKGYYPLPNIIHSQPTDSLFKPMMYNSDNFFAEQTLLMASNEHLGFMSDKIMIDSLLINDFKDIAQKPKWVDGCGLSRYNLFTPQNFVYILNKMKTEFGLDRMKVILPTGGKGTFLNYFKSISGKIYAKTGTLSNNCAVSGYLITQKGKLLIFSILNNNYISSATPIRKATEQFLQTIVTNY